MDHRHHSREALIARIRPHEITVACFFFQPTRILCFSLKNIIIKQSSISQQQHFIVDALIEFAISTSVKMKTNRSYKHNDTTHGGQPDMH